MPSRSHSRASVLLSSLASASMRLRKRAQDRVGQIASALRNQEFDKALELLQPALQASPGNAAVVGHARCAYAGQGQKKEALASFHSALKISPDYHPALQGAAQIEYEAAVPRPFPFLQHLLRLRPDDSTSHGMLAVLEYQQGNCEAAVTSF